MRIAIVSFVANLLGVQFKINGLPHGASYERSKWMQPQVEPRTGMGLAGAVIGVKSEQ